MALIERAQLKQIVRVLMNAMPSYSFQIIPNEYETPSALMLRTSISEGSVLDFVSGQKLWWAIPVAIVNGRFEPLEHRRPYSLGISDAKIASLVAPRMAEEVRVVNQFLSAHADKEQDLPPAPLKAPVAPGAEFRSAVLEASTILRESGVELTLYLAKSATAHRVTCEFEGLDPFAVEVRSNEWTLGDARPDDADMVKAGLAYDKDPMTLAALIAVVACYRVMTNISEIPEVIGRDATARMVSPALRWLEQLGSDTSMRPSGKFARGHLAMLLKDLNLDG